MQEMQRYPGTAERMMKAFSQAGQQGIEGISQKLAGRKEDEALERLTGQNMSGLSPELKKTFVEKMMTAQGKGGDAKQQEAKRGYEVGLGTIKDIEGIIDDLGPLNMGFHPFKSMNARQAYTTYANSLLGILSTIPVRNEVEFENIKKTLADPKAPVSKIKSSVAAAKKIITRHYESLGGQSETQQSQKKERPPLSSFAR